MSGLFCYVQDSDSSRLFFQSVLCFRKVGSFRISVGSLVSFSRAEGSVQLSFHRFELHKGLLLTEHLLHTEHVCRFFAQVIATTLSLFEAWARYPSML